MKMFAEATLGNTVDNSKRAGFIKYDRNVLRFQAVWDDRESLYGDIQRFEVGILLTSRETEILRSIHLVTTPSSLFGRVQNNDTGMGVLASVGHVWFRGGQTRF